MLRCILFFYTHIRVGVTRIVTISFVIKGFITFVLAQTNRRDGMSQEIFEIIKKLDLEMLETQLVLQCSPVLAGLKISNLLNVTKEQYYVLEHVLYATDFSYYILLEKGDKVSLLIYAKDLLENYLQEKKVKHILQAQGYVYDSLDNMLSLLAKRYKRYSLSKDEFPHEMGLFLGYPVEDVQGFIQNQGKNFLCMGYWKVYKDKNEKISLFEQFDKAKEWMIILVSNGIDLLEATEILRKGQLYSICK